MAVVEQGVEGTRGATQAAEVSLSHVSVRLGDHFALRDITFDIAPGSFVGLLGPNGSGKSTLLRTLLGILPTAAGEVRIEGRSPKNARDIFSYLPQRQRVDFETPLRVWDVVMMGRLRQIGWVRIPKPEDKDIVAWALETVRMTSHKDVAIGHLSFGQQQRVFLARALAQQGRLILLDEPMNGVDAQTQDFFVDLLNSFHAEGKTILMATHDLNMASCICDTLCILNQRLIVYGPVAETFKPEALRQAYGTHLHFVEVGTDGHPQVLEDIHHHNGQG